MDIVRPQSASSVVEAVMEDSRVMRIVSPLIKSQPECGFHFDTGEVDHLGRDWCTGREGAP